MGLPKLNFLYNVIDEKKDTTYFGEIVTIDPKELTFVIKLTSEPWEPFMTIPLSCYDEKTEEIVIK